MAALSAWNRHHEAAAAALADVTALPAHALLEAYSVLTRLPAGLALSAERAADVLGRRFPDRPLWMADAPRAALLETLSAAGVAGGASYDALIALEASAHGETLATIDRRACETYRRLGATFRLLGD